MAGYSANKKAFWGSYHDRAAMSDAAGASVTFAKVITAARTPSANALTSVLHANVAATSGHGTPSWQAVANNRVALKGSLTASGAIAAGTAIFTLPAAARPAVTRTFPYVVNDGGVYVQQFAKIDTDGTFKLSTTTLANGDVIPLDGITFDL